MDTDLKKKEKIYKERIASELGGDYLITSEFKGNSKPIEVVHIPCRTKRRLAEARDLFRKGCPECTRPKTARNKVDKRAKGYINQIEEKYNVTAMGEYKGARIHMEFRCNECGNIIRKTPENILWRSGIKCECRTLNYKGFIRALKHRAKELKKQEEHSRRQEEILELCLWYIDNGYDVIDINNNLNGATLKHLKCGREYNATKETMKRRHGCVACSRSGTSLGVQIVERELKNNGIEFEREISFKTCKRERVLPFDFGIKDKSENIICLIEFNGEQHYRPATIFGGNEKFRKVQEADNIKVEWCRDNGIELYVIKYNDDIKKKCNEIVKRYCEK